jgi:uroporphyrinogen-III decarboxylase
MLSRIKVQANKLRSKLRREVPLPAEVDSPAMVLKRLVDGKIHAAVVGSGKRGFLAFDLSTF